MELRRAASGLVKVICRTEESRPNGRGKKPGKPKQKGLLASFEEWFGSINMMNIFMSGSLPAGVPRSLKPFRRVFFFCCIAELAIKCGFV